MAVVGVSVGAKGVWVSVDGGGLVGDEGVGVAADWGCFCVALVVSVICFDILKLVDQNHD